MSDRILRLPDVMAITSLGKSTIYSEISKGRFPKPVKLTAGRSVGWHLSQVDSWVQNRQKTESRTDSNS